MSFRKTIVAVALLCVAVASSAQQSSVTADAHPVASPASPNVDVKTGDSTSSAFRIFNSVNAELLRVGANGNVGIGTTTPGTILHLVRNAPGALGPELRLENNAGYAGDAEGLTFAANSQSRAEIRSTVEGGPDFRGTLEFRTGIVTTIERMRITGAGKVGIGTQTPGVALEVVAQEYGNAFRAVDTAPVNQGFGAGILFRGRTSASEYGDFGAVRAVKGTVTDGDNSGQLRLQVANAAGVLVDAATLWPGRTEFVGTVTGGSIQAQYQDVAEWVPATSDMPPGTVVILNPDQNNEVMPSVDRYDIRVAGVVSEQPGLILGVAGPSKEQIATTGRVRVKVDADAAPIRIGDLLVTSDNPGHAMRSDAIEIQGRKFHQPGTIIGKALEPLASGEGEILVLLSLQ
jgi:hypothetical protein